MARIDYAWSKELNKELTASEAHEKWLLGELGDKTMFECRDAKCNAQITCVNMDKHLYQMKVREHFKVYGEHSPECEEVKETKEIDKRKKTGEPQKAPYIEEEITFNNIRPKNHGEIVIGKKDDSDPVGSDAKTIGKGSNVTGQTKGKRKHNLYLLSTLVSKYLVAKKEHRLDTTRVKVQFDNEKKPYLFYMNNLFVDIKDMEYDATENWKKKVYFGKGVISKKGETEYWINFENCFQGNAKSIHCAIKESVIKNTNCVRGALGLLQKFANKEDVYCFLFGTLNESDKRIFVNIESLDHFACTTEAIYCVDDIKDET